MAETHWHYLQRLREWGFAVNPLSRQLKSEAGCRGVPGARSALERSGLGYDIDGVVYKIDDLRLQRVSASSAARRAGRSPGSFPPNRR